MRAMALLCELVNEKTLFCPSFVNTGNFIAVKELVSVIIMVMNGKKRIAIVAVALIAAAVVGLAALRVAGVWGTKPAVSVSDAEMVPAEPTSASAVSVPVDISSEMPEEPPAVEITEEAYETVATAAEEAEPAIMEIPSTALPVVVSLDGLVAEVGNESAVISYPADISDEDIQSIIAASDDKYGLSEAGVTYVVEEPGVMRVHYGGMSEEEAAAWIGVLYDEALAVLSEPVPVEDSDSVEEETVAQSHLYVPPTPVVSDSVPSSPVLSSPVVTIVEEPVVTVIGKEEAGPEVRIIVGSGVSASDIADPSLNIALGFEVGDIITLGDSVSIGLRTDAALDLTMPQLIMGNTMGIPYFYGTQSITLSLDMKLMFDFDIGIGDIYLGTGAGIVFGTATGQNAVLSGYALSFDWYAVALAGIRFDILPNLSIGTELEYKFLVNEARHVFGARLVLTVRF